MIFGEAELAKKSVDPCRESIIFSRIIPSCSTGGATLTRVCGTSEIAIKCTLVRRNLEQQQPAIRVKSKIAIKTEEEMRPKR